MTLVKVSKPKPTVLSCLRTGKGLTTCSYLVACFFCQSIVL